MVQFHLENESYFYFSRRLRPISLTKSSARSSPDEMDLVSVLIASQRETVRDRERAREKREREAERERERQRERERERERERK